MTRILPLGYAVSGLAALQICAVGVLSLSNIAVRELVGSGRSSDVLYVGAAGAAVFLFCATLLAMLIGAYAIPLGMLVGALVSGAVSLGLANRHLNQPITP